MTLTMWVKALVKILVLPPTGLLLLALAGVLIAGRRPRLGRSIALASIVGVLLLSTSSVALLLLSALHPPLPFDADEARDAQAVVVLGAGLRRNAVEYGGDTVSRLTLERVRYGARIARITALPVLVSGGSSAGSEPEAVVMRRVLQEEFNTPVRWIEPLSRNTHENAFYSSAILKGAGVRKIVLVTHGFDMLRGRAEFERTGLQVVPAATNLIRDGPGTWLDWIPTIGALQASYYALYELIANAVR